MPLFLYSFAYGAITSFSALYADSLGITPKSVYLTTLAVDDPDHTADLRAARRPLRLPSRLRAMPRVHHGRTGRCSRSPTTRSGLMLSAVVFGTGFGTAYPVFAAYVTHGVSEDRRGAAFGAILAAFDTGIGTGSSSLGWLVATFGYDGVRRRRRRLSALALPAFLFADRQVGPGARASGPAGAGMTPGGRRPRGRALAGCGRLARGVRRVSRASGRT